MLHSDLQGITVEEYLRQHERKDLLRFLTCGSVDDGKSTLIGRLLHDTKLVYEDQLAALERDSQKVGHAGTGVIDFALLCDGLKAEREQGITIDVAYRFFSTAKRTFIIADCPGHEQYTRNMATGASNCDLAIILIDARYGVVTQTKRHSFIVALLGIRHVVVAINKMDLVAYDQKVYERIRQDYVDFAAKLDLPDVRFIPVAALHGENIVETSPNMPWYQDRPLLAHLEGVHIASDRNLIDFRFPVQTVIRPDLTYRGFAGTIASGAIHRGDAVMALPSGKPAVVTRIVTFDGDLETAHAPMAVTLTLDREIDVGRGDMLVHPGNLPSVARDFEAMLVWMSETPLDPNGQYWVRGCTGSVPGMVSHLEYLVDVNTLHRKPGTGLSLNEIARVTISCVRPLPIDPYRRNRATGGFILIDRLTNATVAAGMVRDVVSTTNRPGQPATEAAPSRVTAAERAALLRQRSGTVWITGLPCAGKSAIAALLERKLYEAGRLAMVLDGSALRHDLSRDLGFSAADRREQVRRLAAVARLGAEAGLIIIVAATSPYAEDRNLARASLGQERFFEVYASAPADWCEANDPTGAWAKARSGAMPAFTGVSMPYEPPTQPDLVLPTHELAQSEAADRILAQLRQRGWLLGG